MDLFNVSEARISLDEIARINDVSLSTVYRVIRNAGKIRTPRHDRLRLMLANAGYLSRPDRVAGAILLVTDVQLSAHGLVLLNFLREMCEQSGIETILAWPATYAAELKRRSIAGIIALTAIDCPAAFPCVFLNRRDRFHRHSMVVQNLEESALLLLDTLREIGHTRIGFFEETGQSLQFRYLQGGLLELGPLCEIAGLEWHPEWYFRHEISDLTHFEVCRAAADYFATLKDRPEVLVMRSDLSAVTIAQEWRRSGIEVPRDIQLAACDDSLQWPLTVDRQQDAVYSTITSFRPVPMYCASMPLREMAATALELLQARLKNPRFVSRQVVFQPEVKLYEPQTK